jgi:hypothetical protein
MLKPSETSLIGQWVTHGSGVVADDNCRRIQELVATHLQQLARSADGWSCLYFDPADGRMWEQIYPESEMHGGGPPALICVSQEQALAKYGVGA